MVSILSIQRSQSVPYRITNRMSKLAGSVCPNPTDSFARNMESEIEKLLDGKKFNYCNLALFLGGDEATANAKALSLFQTLELVPDRMKSFVLCPYEYVNGEICGQAMKSYAVKGPIIGFRYRCRGLPGATHKDTAFDPRRGTIFEGAQIAYRQMLKLLYFWYFQYTVADAIRETGVGSDTAVHHYHLFNEAVSVVAWHRFQRLGGPGDVVELDESLIRRRKSHKGRAVPETWFFGGVSRTTGDVFALRIEMQDKVTVCAEVMDCVKPGSIICTGGWEAYGALARLPVDVSSPRWYRGHEVVLRNGNFIHPPRDHEPLWVLDINDECIDKQHDTSLWPCPAPHPQHGAFKPVRYHTQSTTRHWRSLKDKVKRSVRDQNVIDYFMGNYMYRRNVLRKLPNDHGQRFRQLISDMAEVYPGLNLIPIKANKPYFRIYPPPGYDDDTCDCDTCAR